MMNELDDDQSLKDVMKIQVLIYNNYIDIRVIFIHVKWFLWVS